MRASGLLEEFPELAGQALALGIFGRGSRSQSLQRDRVEIYRPLRSIRARPRVANLAGARASADG